MSEQDTTGRQPGQPDPDAPPSSGGDAHADQARDDASDETPQQPEAEPRPARAGTAQAGDEPRRSTQLGPAAAGTRPPSPPRRTGVFIDPDDLREHVGGLLRAILGGYEVDAWGNFTFSHEDARVFVTVAPSPIGPQVGVFSVTNLEIELSPQLGAFLLTTNHQLGFGSFSYDPDSQAVWLRHSLLGTTLDGPELQSAVAAVASTAAHFDDRIRDQFGGRAFHDAPDDVRQAHRPPEPSQQPPNASGYL